MVCLRLPPTSSSMVSLIDLPDLPEAPGLGGARTAPRLAVGVQGVVRDGVLFLGVHFQYLLELVSVEGEAEHRPQRDGPC